jgi:hypothetical protein
MSAAGNTVTPAAWTSWSPGSDNRTKIHRRFVQVPSDQQKLLDRAELAWVPRGFPNVPPGVLEDVKTHNARACRPRTPVGREALSSQPTTPVPDAVEALSSQAVSLYQARMVALSSQPASPAQTTTVHEQSNRTSAGTGGDSDGEEEASGTSIPWSSSPPSHFGGPLRQQELPTTTGSRSRRFSGQDDRRAEVHTLARAPILDFPPSSSAASGPVLEVEVPKAITDVLEPVDQRLAAVLEPTPPSAQVMPCTNTEITSPAKASKTQRRRRMKQFPAAILASLDPAGRGDVSGVTLPEGTADAPSRLSSPVVSPSSPISGLSRTDLALSAPGNGQIPASAKQPDNATSTSQLVGKQVSSNPSVTLPRNGPPSQAPFVAFIQAYPDYKGSLGDFLRGVMCILQLQKERALSEFLYDDFVRVFAGDYLDYIMTVVHDQPALPAVQFYNLNVSRPLYTKSVLTKDNIKDVANQYPKKTRAIQHILEEETPETVPRSRPTRQTPGSVGGDKTAAQPAFVTTKTAGALRHNGLPSAASFMGSGLVPQMAELPTDSIPMTSQPWPAQEHRGPVGPLENSAGNWGLSAVSPPRPKAPKFSSTVDATAPNTGVSRTSIDSSQPDAVPSRTPRVMRTQLPVASTLPPSTALSNPDNIPEVTLKRKARISTASSAAGQPGAEFKRPRLTPKDAEKRAQRFRQFLLRKQTQSSAPEGSAPS